MAASSRRQMHGIPMVDILFNLHQKDEAERKRKEAVAQNEREEAAQRVATRVQELKQHLKSGEASTSTPANATVSNATIEEPPALKRPSPPTAEQLERARRNREAGLLKRAASDALHSNAPTAKQLEQTRTTPPTPEQLARAQRNREAGLLKRMSSAVVDNNNEHSLPKFAKAARPNDSPLDASVPALITIGGLRVRLPIGLRPYRTQMRIMVKQVACLRKADALLMTPANPERRPISLICDAPTGSGKTIALLAPSLSWLAEYKQRQRERRAVCPIHSTVSNASSMCAECVCLSNVTVIYCTRTKVQMKQAIGQYSTLPYCTEGILRHTVLGPREDLCLSPKAESRVKSGAAKSLTDACLKMMGSRGGGCNLRHALYARYDRAPSELRKRVCNAGNTDKAFDLDDLLKALDEDQPKVCPYYAATDVLAATADVLFCTFNYVMDPLIRERVGCVKMENSILICDEAHGLTTTCCDVASHDFELNKMRAILHSLDDCQRYTQARLDELQSKYKGTAALKISNSLESLRRRKQDIRNISAIVTAFVEWYQTSACGTLGNSLDMTCDDAVMTLTLAMPDSFMEIFLETTDVGVSASSITMSAGEAVFRFYDKCPDDELLSFEHNMSRPTDETIEMLMRFLNVTRLVSQHPEKYRCTFKVEKTDGTRPCMQSFTDFAPSSVYSVQFWPIDASVGFRDATKACLSVCLASATLSPAKAYARQFGTDFDFTLEGLDSVISPNNVFAVVIERGPFGNLLKGTRDNTPNADCVYFKEVASVIVYVCTITPRGVLCFLPSLAMLNKLLTSMRNSGVYAELVSVKEIYVEGTTAGVDLAYYRNAILRGRDAILFAVCRGRASEGLNFEDDMARAVLVVSVPYPNIGDTRVKLRAKRMANDDWLSVQAMAAVTQVIGRSLRHAFDWSSVVLIDSRYSIEEYQKLMPRLISGSLRQYAKLSDLVENMEKFYLSMQSKSMGPATAAMRP